MNKKAVTNLQKGNLIIEKASNYTLEQLADDFRCWASRRLNRRFGSTGSAINEIKLGYEIVMGVGFKGYEPVGTVTIEANGIARISLNKKSEYSSNLPIEEYKPFQRKVA